MSPTRRRYKERIAAFAASCLIALAGCGGGGGSSEASLPGSPTPGEPDDPPPGAAPSSISGVTAAGVPLVGFVAARDSGGNGVTAEIGDDGSFTLELADLEPPYLIYASGLAAGRAYVILSVATESDLGETVNVTPLTDLIVGNIAGANPTTFFNDPDFSLLTDQALSEAEATLRERLAPLLTAAGVDADAFDLRTSPFLADRSGFDAVLDLLDVTVQGDIAVIRNRLTDEVIEDDLTDASDTSALSDVSGTTAAIDASTAIATRMAAFAALAAGDAPEPVEVDDFLTADFLFDGLTRDDILELVAEAQQDAELADDLAEFYGEFGGFVLTALGVDTGTGDDIAVIDIGQPISLSNDGSGWRLAGNGRLWAVEAQIEHFRDADSDAAMNVLTLEAEFAGSAADAGEHDVILVTGPGLPEAGVVLRQFFLSDPENPATPGEFLRGVELSDAQAAAIPRGAVYIFTRLDGDDELIDQHSTRLIMEPIATNEAIELPDIVSPDQQGLAAFSAGELAVQWTLPMGYRSDSVVLDRVYAGSGIQERAAEAFVAGDATARTLEAAAPSAALGTQTLYVFTRDVFGRMVAVYRRATLSP